eukprot:660355_1
MHMQKMKLFALLALTCVYVCTDAITGDSFSSYYGYGWTSTTLDCNDFVPCTVNCWGGASCVSVSINGPKNSSLTINCDSEFGGGGTNGVSSCIQMSIYAENSTSLTINVYNEDYGFKNNFVYTPNTNNPLVANTFITCGLIEDHNPSTPTTYSCGSQNNIYSLNGWSTVEWSYAGNASWALNLEPSIDPNTMRCGGDYQDSCELVLDGFYYRCSQSSVCDYDRSGEPQSHPQQGLPPTTSQPTSSPVAPTSSPTNPGDLASVYSSNTTLSSSMTYNVVSDIQIEEYTVFTVPGDVDIVFKGSYNIWVYGTINIGCDSIDTLSNHDIGIISESQLISIYNEDNSTRKGQILIVLGGSASFCNTRFTNLFSIFYRGWYPSPNVMSLIVDNCEFDNVGDSSGAAIGFYEACESNHELQQITDSKFINSDDGIKNAICTNIENNVFESPILCVYDSIINNNVFGSADHDGVHAVTTCGGSPNITFNTFINWQQAIRIVDSGRDPVNIFYNQFIDNEYAVFIGIRYAQHINYNNFVNNSYSIYESCGYTNTIRYIEMCGQPNCGYNYYGASSSNQSIISSQIYDICDGGQGHGLVTWWPWYTEPIDFNSLPTTLQEHNFDVIECPAADLHPGITDNKLAPIYPHDTTLASSNSPYYIVGAVRITTDATVYVESGVELIFADHYDIDITGALVTGCHAVETMNNHTIGIISDTDLISISSIDTTRRGRVVIQEEGSGSFCNTKFETLNSAIYRSYTSEDTNWNTLRLLIDNCEFYNNGYGVEMSRDAEENAHISTQITDSKFLYNTESFSGVLSANITNNLFENAGDQTAINIYSNVNIFRNTLTYNTTGWSKNGEGLYLMGINVNIRSNTFSNWPTAIRATWDNHGEPPIVILSMVVTQNEFIENTVAIDLDTPEQQRINYNNFIQNGYNIRSRNDKNQTHCNYNWNGDVDNITHPHLIASKIYDACDSDYYDGIVTFWPYFEEALDLTDLTQLPGMYSLDFVNCSFMNHTRAEYHRGVTSDPTIEPTANPTMRPTDDSIFSKISLNKLYMFVGNNPLNFFEAWRYCQDEYNTTLAQVHNEQQNQEMYSLVNQYSNYPAWIAASDLFMGENNWNWLDSMGPIALNDMNYTNWNATQPDNLNNEDCAIMLITDNNDQWGDADCNDASYNFVCYAPDETKPPTAAPTASPSQAPSPAPTKDPTPSPVQPPGYPYWFEWSSHFNYVWVNLTTNWFQASFVCQQDFGTDIASIHSEEDNAEAYEVCKDKNCWIGATDIPVHTFGTWQWNDQTAFEYTNWPNNIEPSLTYSSGIKFSDGPSGSEWTAVDADDTHLTVLCNGFPTPAPTPPSQNPTRAPSMIPSQVTNQPSISPSLAPTATPTKAPSSAPSRLPTGAPTTSPTIAPSTAPTELPTDAPSAIPSTAPSTAPTELPTAVPSDSPSLTPTTAPTELPTAVPSDSPTLTPTTAPTELPTAVPSSSPSKTPSAAPTQPPSIAPSAIPTETPSAAPSQSPSLSPTNAPSSPPSSAPTHPTINPTLTPSISPSQPTINPTMNPSVSPTPPTTPLPTYVGQYKSDICFTGSAHSVVDGEYSYYGWLSEPRYGRYQGAIYHTWDGDDLYLHPWRDAGTGKHYYLISRDPSEVYSAIYGTSYAYCMLSTLNGYEHDIADCFTSDSSVVWKYKWGSMQTDYTIDANLVVEKCNTPEPTIRPTDPIPTSPTTTTPTTDTNTPTARPSVQPTQSPTKYPTTSPTKTPTQTPTETTLHPTDDPSKTPTEAPSAAPTQLPSTAPSTSPTKTPTQTPTETTLHPTDDPSKTPTEAPSAAPTQPPSAAPSTPPTKTPSTAPTQPPSVAPTDAPSSPSLPPSAAPTHPTINPTLTPSKSPSQPTINPTPRPSVSPTPPTTPQPTYVGQYRSDICFTGSQTIGVNGEYSYYGWVSEYYTEGAVYSYSYQGNTYYLRPWFDEGSWGHYYVITPSYYASTIYAYCHLSSSQPSYYTYDIAGCFSANNQWYYRSANGQAVLDSNLVAEKCNTPEPTNRPTYRPTNRPTRSPLARGDTHAPSKPPTQSPTYTEMTCGSTVSGTLHEGVHFYTLRLDSFAYSVHMKSCNSEFDVYLYDENYNEIETNVTYCASKRRAFHFVDVPAGGYAVGIGGFESYYGYYEMDIICDSAPIPTTTDLVASSEDDDHCELPSVHCNTQHVSFAHLRDGAFEFMVYDTSIWSSVHVIYFVWPYNEDNRRRLADDTACTQPSLSLEYEAIDNSYQYQNIRVFIEDTMIGNCYGQSERCEYTQCLDEFDLNTLDVDDISEIKSIRLLKGGPIRAYCDHNNTMRVRVVLKCKPIGDGFDVSPIDVGADDGLLGLIYFCVTFTILVFIWALSYFISNTKDTLKKNKAGSFKDVIKGSSKLNFISYGSAIYDTVSDFILSSDIMASAADSPNPALWRGLGSLSILTSIIGAVLFVLKIRILLQLLPRVVKWRSDRDEKLEEMARLIKTKENNGAHHIKLWYKTKQNHNDIKKYKGHIIMFNLFPIALENSIQCIVLFYIQYEALTNTSSGNVWDVLMWLKVVTSLFFMCFGIAKAFGIRWGFHQDSLDIGLKPNNAVDPEKKPNAYPFAYVRDGPPPQPSIGQLQNYINNNGQTYTSGGGMFVGQMPQPQEGNAPLPTGATGEEEEELVPGDDDSYHTDVEEHSIVNIELPAIQPQGPPQDPFKTLEYVMKAEEIRAKAEANQVGRQNLLDTAYPEQEKVDEGQDETIALTSDDTESNDETQANENEVSSASPSDEREDHSSAGIEMVNVKNDTADVIPNENELMNEEDVVVDADSSERDEDDVPGGNRPNEMNKEIEMKQPTPLPNYNYCEAFTKDDETFLFEKGNTFDCRERSDATFSDSTSEMDIRSPDPSELTFKHAHQPHRVHSDTSTSTLAANASKCQSSPSHDDITCDKSDLMDKQRQTKDASSVSITTPHGVNHQADDRDENPFDRDAMKDQLSACVIETDICEANVEARVQVDVSQANAKKPTLHKVLQSLRYKVHAMPSSCLDLEDEYEEMNEW